MSEEKGLVKYEDRSGQEITLSFDIVKNYLVSGKKELVTPQELMFFMGICKARGLNPFAKEVYLVKYTPNDPAAIITSVDFFRARARAQKDCHGWQKGIVVQKPDGELRYSKGIILEGEKLVGGWFKAKPQGWDEPFELEVNLNGYVKKTSEGKTTKFWSEANQPTMIAKVAESQGLRSVWPNEFRGLYTPEEMDLGLETIDIEPKDFKEIPVDAEFFATMPEEEVEAGQSVFGTLVQTREINSSEVEEFVKKCSEYYKRPPEEIKAEASINPDNFFAQFDKWLAKKSAAKPDKKAEKTRGKVKEEPPKAQGTNFTSSCLQHGSFEGDSCPECDKQVKQYKQKNQGLNGKEKASPAQVSRIKELAANLGHSLDAICADYSVATVEDLSPADAVSLITWLKNQDNSQGQE